MPDIGNKPAEISNGITRSNVSAAFENGRMPELVLSALFL